MYSQKSLHWELHPTCILYQCRCRWNMCGINCPQTRRWAQFAKRRPSLWYCEGNYEAYLIQVDLPCSSKVDCNHKRKQRAQPHFYTLLDSLSVCRNDVYTAVFTICKQFKVCHAFFLVQKLLVQLATYARVDGSGGSSADVPQTIATRQKPHADLHARQSWGLLVCVERLLKDWHSWAIGCESSNHYGTFFIICQSVSKHWERQHQHTSTHLRIRLHPQDQEILGCKIMISSLLFLCSYMIYMYLWSMEQVNGWVWHQPDWRTWKMERRLMNPWSSNTVRSSLYWQFIGLLRSSVHYTTIIGCHWTVIIDCQTMIKTVIQLSQFSLAVTSYPLVNQHMENHHV